MLNGSGTGRPMDKRPLLLKYNSLCYRDILMEKSSP